jgi:hypothetical protein
VRESIARKDTERFARQRELGFSCIIGYWLFIGVFNQKLDDFCDLDHNLTVISPECKEARS